VGIPLKIVDPFPEYALRTAGMMWRYVDGDVPGRECWWIILPPSPDQGKPGHPGQLSWRTTDKASAPPHQMWNVSGIPPKITVTPSIDILRYVDKNGKWVREGSYWHGFITAGEIVG
jgi:hypothetical protein